MSAVPQPTPHVDEQWWGSLRELRPLLDSGYLGDFQEASRDTGGGFLMECPLYPSEEHFVHVLERRADHAEFGCSHECSEEAIRARVLDFQALVATAPLDGLDESAPLPKMGESAVDLAAARPGSASGPCVSLRDYVALERPPLDPYLATRDDRTVLLAAETALLSAGPSGLGKSLAVLDLAGRLAAEHPSDWLGFRVRAGLRVLLLSFEGSDEDTAERVASIVPDDARDRFLVWDRWRAGPPPRADDGGLERLAAEVRRHAVDVLVIDTGSAFFGGAHDCSKGIPEEAFGAIERVRELAGRPVAVIVVAHTKKADRTGARVDELEEIAGTFGRKVDTAIVMRRDGERGPRRRLVFPKTRRGPEPPAKVATLPTEADEPPRLALLHDLDEPGVKPGTEVEAIAEFVRAQPGVVSPQAILERFDISDGTLRARRPELERLDISYRRRPAVAGNAYGYGADEQWGAEGALFDG